MKKLVILLALFICGFCCFCGCRGSHPSNTNRPIIKGVYSTWDMLIIVNGCQYAVMTTADGYRVYTHIGTCTNCWGKMEKLIGKKINVEKE